MIAAQPDWRDAADPADPARTQAQLAAPFAAGIFVCLQCRAQLSAAGPCADCGFVVEEVEGVPLLIRERAVIEEAIETARSAGRAAWYEKPQEEQWRGPYRHHLKRRRAYLDTILADYAVKAARPLTGLDLGCGDGMHLGWLGGYVTELYGSDYNLIRLGRASRLNRARCVFLADVTDYPVRDDAFDVIFFNHVLEHIPDDRAALREAHRILRPGGLLMLGTPNEGAWFWQLAYRLEPRMLRLSDHVQFYTAETLSAKCRETGFTVQQVKHIGYGVPHWTLDAGLRQFKVLDDLFEALGRRLCPAQATSLYLILTK